MRLLSKLSLAFHPKITFIWIPMRKAHFLESTLCKKIVEASMLLLKQEALGLEEPWVSCSSFLPLIFRKSFVSWDWLVIRKRRIKNKTRNAGTISIKT